MIDIYSFDVFEKINFFNLNIETLVSFFVLYPLTAIQKYKKQTFYKPLYIGFYLLFVSLFTDALDQIFIHSIFYTLVFEKLTLFAGVIFIFDGSKKWMANFEKLSHTDELTKLANRKLINLTLESDLTTYGKNNKKICLALLDIDYFKNINDKYGHSVGDNILKSFSHFLTSLINKKDFIGRWGGEEFIIIIRDKELEQAKECLEYIREKISKHTFTYNELKINLTASIGVCEFDPNKHDSNSLFNMVDNKMYQSKKQGRNQVNG